ncbi:MAG: FHA domain-containing protein [Chloroflexota bacterium]|nr:FHA domain-containing protein [Chloroflexota bacterium]
MNAIALIVVLVALAIVVAAAVLATRRRRAPEPPALSATSADRTIVGLAAPGEVSDATMVGPMVAPSASAGPAAARPAAETSLDIPVAATPATRAAPPASAEPARPDETEPTLRIPKLRALVTVIRGGSGTYELSAREYTIGRSTRSDIVLEDPSVSGHHALLVPHGEAFAINDLASTNGTTVNGRPVTATQVLHGEETIGVGDALLRYERIG